MANVDYIFTLLDENAIEAKIVGVQGPMGPQGVPGPPGEKGDDGPIGLPGAGITDITQNQDGTLTISIADGSSYITQPLKGADGEPGKDGYTPEITASKSGTVTTIYVDGNPIATVEDGTDGYTPVITASKSGSVTTISVDGSPVATISDGVDGQDGYTPSITATKSAGVTTIFVDGVAIATVSDGQDGSPGAAGQDGFSPSASVSKSGSTATITITDKNGTTTATVSDGQDGTDGNDGQDGFSPSASASKSGSITTITITDKNGTTTATVSDGQNGQDGADGQDGHSPVKGTDYWTSSDKAEIVEDVVEEIDLSDYAHKVVVEQFSGSTPTITAQANHRYVCGTVTSLSFTPSATGICDVIFTSGSTPAVLTLPNTVKLPDWFSAGTLNANTTYEINIMDGVYGVVMAWT